jgi:hypothetical protein
MGRRRIGDCDCRFETFVFKELRIRVIPDDIKKRGISVIPDDIKRRGINVIPDYVKKSGIISRRAESFLNPSSCDMIRVFHSVRAYTKHLVLISKAFVPITYTSWNFRYFSPGRASKRPLIILPFDDAIQRIILDGVHGNRFIGIMKAAPG